jgi:hypothetical protein
MKDSQFDKWLELARALAEAKADKSGRSHADDIARLYEARYEDLIDPNGSKKTLFIRENKKKDPAPLDLRFADYALTLSIDTLISFVSLDRARESSDERLLRGQIHTQLEDCSKDIETYTNALGNEKASFDAVYQDLLLQKESRDAMEAARKAQEEAARSLRAPRRASPAKATPRKPRANAATATSVPAVQEPAARLPRSKAAPARDDVVVPPIPRKLFTQLGAELTVTQLIILREAAAYVADQDTKMESDLKKRLGPDPSILTEQERTRIDETLRLVKQRRDLFKNDAAAFERALTSVTAAKEELSKLKRLFDGEHLRKAMAAYLRPIAQYYESSSPALRLVRNLAVFVVCAGLGLAAFLALANAYWPYFGQLGAVSAVSALACATLGTWFSRDPLGKDVVARQKTRFRHYIEDVLRTNDAEPDDILKVLGGEIGVPPGPAKSKDDVLRSPLMYRFSGRVSPKDDFVFKGVGKVRTGRWKLGSLGVGVAVGAIALSTITTVIPSLLASFVVRTDMDRTQIAQILRQVEGRELCEVAQGRVAWQDENNLYLTTDILRPAAAGAPREPAPLVASQTVAIARSDATEVRFGTARTGAQPCQTQEDFFGRTLIDISVPQPDVVVAGGTNVTIATTPVAISVPDDPTRSILQFYTTVFVDGTPVDVPTPDASEWSYVILPVFTERVELKDSRLHPDSAEYADRISKLALCSSRDLELREAEAALRNEWCQGWDAGETVFLEKGVAPIREALSTLRRQGCSIKVDVQGFASDNDFDGADDERNEELNWLLAEGRRAAVLLALGFSAESAMFVLEAGEQGKKLGALDLQSFETGVFVSGLKWHARFSGFDDMRSELGRWLDLEIQKGDLRQDGLAEALERSVVIAVAREDLANCRLPSAEGTLTAAAG